MPLVAIADAKNKRVHAYVVEQARECTVAEVSIATGINEDIVQCYLTRFCERGLLHKIRRDVYADTNIPVPIRVPLVIDTHELAWAAGFFDGEGCFTYKANGNKGAMHRYAVATISQVDPAVLRRFQKAIGFGSIHPRRGSRYNPNARDQSIFYISNFQHFQALGAFLWKWLSPVKRQQFTRVLACYLADRRK